MNKLKIILLSAAVMMVAVSHPCAAGTIHENQKYVLTGLRNVGVKIEYYDVEAKQEWWCRSEVIEDAVTLLKDYGLNVVDDSQRVGEPGMPFIHVGVHVFQRRDPNFIGLYGYSITLSLRETVKLDRNLEETAHAITWTKSAEGSVAQYRLLSMLEFRTETLVEDFIMDYLVANRIRARIPELQKRMESHMEGRREYDQTINTNNGTPPDYKSQ